VSPPPEAPADAEREARRQDALAEAKNVAEGSGIAMFGVLINRGLRMVNTWQLSTSLGTYGFGLYTSVTTVVSVMAFFAPLGMNSGVVLFGSRYLGSGEKARLKGAMISTLGIATVSGIAWALLFVVGARAWPWGAEKADLGATLPYGALSIAAWSVLLVAVNALRVARDAKAQTSVYNITLPLLLTTLSALAAWGGLGTRGALIAFGVAHLLTFGEAMWRYWRHFGALLADRTIKAQYELGPLLRFSLPESLSSMLLWLTQWMDLLQLSVQSTMDQVGIYKVASALAMVGGVPGAALSSILNATVAELLYLNKREQLDHVLKLSTRWMAVTAGAAYLGIVLGQDIVYAIFNPEYAVGASSLVALLLGQLVATLCVPAAALIPMSGKARLNLINGVSAALLNLGLNVVLIPRWGALGASVATMVTLILWSLWRVAQVWRMLRCFPFTWGSVLLPLGTVLLAWALRAALQPMGLVVHGVATVLAPLLLVGGLWRYGRTPDDEVILAPIERKIRRILGRKAQPRLPE